MMQGFLEQLHFFGAACTGGSFFGLPTWYSYLAKAGRIGVDPQTNTCGLIGSFNYSDLTLIGLAVLDILLRIGGMVAVGYIIYGGIQYVTSQGEPDKTSHAQSVIINALIGLGITVISAAIISFIGNSLG